MPADRRMLEMLALTGLECTTAREGWERSTRLTPMLFRLLCEAPSPAALRVCIEWLGAVGRACDDPGGEVAETLARVSEGPDALEKLAELWDRAVNERHPARAALVDAALHVAEVWSAPAADENEPLQRAQDASSALVSAWLLRRGGDVADKLERATAQEALANLLRAASPCEAVRASR